MNKIYRLVWNATLQTWVVASEFASAKGKGKNGTTRRAMIRAGTMAGAFAASLLTVEPARAWVVNPTNVQNSSANANDGGAGSNTAMGSNARATGSGNSTAVGNQSLASGASATAVGAGASATGLNSVAMGINANAIAVSSIAIGNAAYSNGSNYSISIGDGAQTSGGTLSGGNVALGWGTVATSTGTGNNIAIGSKSKATGTQSSVAIGDSALASSAGAASIGFQTNASGGNSTALGAYATSGGNASVAVGNNASSSGQSSFAMGEGATATNGYTLAAGSGSTASGVNATALGMNTKASANASVALGSGATTTTFTSTPSITVNGKTKTVAGGTATSTVSVGSDSIKRTITNVAAGQVSATSTDAINGSELFALGDTPLTFAGNSGTVDKKLGNTLNIQGTSATAGTYSGKNLKTVVDASGVMQLQMADNPVVNSVIATDGTNTSTLAANGLTVTGGPSVTTTGINAGGKKVVNVADGDVSATSTDAINGSQLNTTNEQVTTNTTNIANNTTNINSLKDDALQWDATLEAFSANHMGNGPAKITNVAAGDVSATSSDAINGSQLYQIAGNTSNTYITQNGTGVKYVRTNDAGLTESDAFAQGKGSTAVGYNASTDIVAISALAMGNDATASVEDGVALGSGSKANKAAGIAGYSPNGASAAQIAAVNATTSTLGGVSVGDADNGQFRQINGVAAGTAASDAVNVAQLQASIGASTADAVLYDSSAHNKVTLGGASSTTPVSLTNVAAGELSDTSTDAVNGSQLKATNDQVDINTTNIAGNTTAITNLGDEVDNIYNTGTKYFHANSTGTDSSATGVDAIAIGMGSVADVARSVALGDGAKTAAAVGTSSATIGGQSYAFAGTAPVGTVSVGDVGAERTITNVAAGRLSDTSTDAVNGSQLNATNEQVTTNTTNIANNMADITNLGDTVDNIYNTGTKYFHANSTGTDSVASGVDAVAIGMGAIASADGSIALGAGSLADGSTLAHQAYLVGGTAQGEVNVGNRRLTGLAAGADDMDGVNVAQLKAVTANSVADAVMYDNSSHDHITLGGDTYDNSTHTGGTTITNVADGVAPSDAVNYSQLTETNTNVTNLGDEVDNIYNTGTKYFHANSTGTDSSATGVDAIAIGMGSVADVARSVALGDGAKTAAAVGTGSATIGGQSYAFAGTAPVGTVSVGDVGAERTITNVAAGRLSETSTDAVNGSQLNATNEQVTTNTTNIANNTADIAGNTTNIANNTVNIDALQDDALQWDPTLNAYSADHMGNGPAKITNVAAGELSATSTDAVNGSQLNATNEQVTTNTTNIANNMADITNLGDTVDNIYNTGTKYFHANSTGTDSVASGVDAVAIGMGAIASADGSIALGAGSLADGSTLAHQAYLVGGTAQGEVNLGNRRLTGLAAGADDMDGVNVAQLKAVTANSVADAVMYDNSSHDHITLGGDSYDNSTHTGGTTITNVADGVAPSDAVNYSQLTETNTNVTNLGDTVTNLGDTVTNLGDEVDNIYNTGTKYFHANSTGTDSSATGVDAIAIGMGSVADVARSVALGDGAKTAAAVGTSSATIGGQSYAFAGTAPVGTVSVGDVGAERTITNVAAGRLSETSTDAVNGSQLNATNEQVTTNTTNIANNTADIAGNTTNIANNTVNIDALQDDALQWDPTLNAYSADHMGNGPAKITNVAAGELSATSTDAVNGSQLNATNEQVTTNTTNIANNMADITNLGDTVDNIYNTGTKYFHANSTGTDSVASGVDAVAIGMGAIASADGSIALGAGSLADGSTLAHQAYLVGGTAQGEVNLGNRRLTGLAAGADDMDGVNVAQLKAVTANSVADAVMYDNSSHDHITLGGDSYDNSTHTGGTTITNVADGVAPSDAVNYSQLTETNTNVTNLGDTVTNLGDTVTNLGDEVDNIYNTGTKYFHANSTGTDSSATGVDAIAIGMGSVADVARSVALGDGAKTAAAVGTSSATIGGQSYAFAGTAPVGTVSVGDVGAERTITNVAAGRLSDTSTDAVNGSQLNATNEQVTTNTTNIANNTADIAGNTTNIANNTVNIDALQDDALQWDPTLNAYSADHMGNGPAKITNVAAGELSATSTDAVNGSQLNATNEQVTTNTTNIANNTADIAGNTTNIANNTVNIDALQDDALQWDPTLNAYSADHMGNGPAKITNVAAGELSATSTDAVNGSQLNATNEQVTTNTTNIANNTADIAGNTTNIANNTVNIDALQDDALQWDPTLNAYSADHMGNGPAKITNVAAGELSATSTDAVNGSQLNATNEQVTTNTTNIANNMADITNLGDTVDNIYNTGTKYFHANSTGTDSVASGVDAVAIGMGAIASADGSIALGAGSVADGSTLTNQAYLVGGTAQGEVNVGNRRLTGLAAGADDMDGVNVAQLKAVTANSVADAVMYDNSSHDHITLGGDSYDNSTHTGGTTITNVADGVAPSDAVNYSQLTETNTNVTNLGDTVTNLGDTVTNLGDEVDNIYNTGTKYFHANSTGTDSSATGVDAIAIGMGSVADVARSVALGDGAKTAAAVGTSSATIGGQSYAFAGTAPVGTVSVGDVGAERTITNVAAGRLSDTSTDAVNGSQLNATNEQVTTNTTNIANNMADITNLGDDVNNIYNTGTKYFHANSTGTDSSATGVDAVAIGMGAIASADGSIALGAGSQADGSTLSHEAYLVGGKAQGEVNLGDRRITGLAAGADDMDGVNVAQLKAVTANSVADAVMYDNSSHDHITLGGDSYDNSTHTGGTTITNVADGVAPSDAVNYSQLTETNTNVTNLGDTVTNLGDEVDNIYNTGTKYFHANSTGTDSSATGVDAIAIGMGSVADVARSVALGDGAKTAAAVGTSSATIGGQSYAFAGTAPVGTVSVGDVGAERTITNVAAGRLSDTSTDAVNGSQLFASNQAIDSITNNFNGLDGRAVKYDLNADGTVNHDRITLEGAPTQITNVAAGELSATSTDAVNGSQLNATNEQVTTNTTNIANNTADIAGNTTNIASNTVNIDGLKDDALQWDATANGGDGAYSANHMGNGPAKITNVAAGDLTDTSTDAVNGSQLKATNDQVTTNTTNIANNAADITNLGDDVNNIYNTGTKYFHANSTGTDSSATGVDAIAIGMGSVADVARSVALGDGAKTAAAVGTGSATIGGQSYAFAGTAPVGTVSVGDVGAERTITNVAAGRLSETSTDAVNGSQLFASNQAIDSITNNFNGLDGRAVKYDLNADGTVNHDRITLEGAPTQITNVAAGELSATSTDAVNGSQLNATNEQVTTNTTNIANNTADIAGNTTNIANNTVNIDGLKDDALQWDPTLNAYSADHMGNGPAKITNVAAGELSATSTDAVNGSQLNATNEQVTTNTTNIANNMADITNLGDTVDNIYNTGTKYFHANSTGTDSVASGVDAVAIGMGAIASADGSIALGAGSLADGSTLAHQAYLVGGTAQGEVNVGNRRLTGLAAGADDMDGVNVAQLKAVTANSVADAVMYDNSSHDHITLGGDSYDNSTHTGGTTITNVADGVAPSDAVNYSQLTETNTNVTNLGDTVTNLGDTVTNLGDEVDNIYNTGTKYFHANSTGTDSSATGVDAIAIGMGSVADVARSVALGDGAKTAAAVGTSSATIGGQSYAFAGTAPVGTVSVGDVGAERTITNVAAGRLSDTSTDAVNGSQLFASNQAIDSITNNFNGLDGRAVKYDLNADGTVNHDRITLEGAPTQITNVAAGELSATSTDAVNGSQLNATNEQVTTNTTNIANNTADIAGNTTNIASNTVNIDGLKDDALQWDATANGGDGAYSANHMGNGPAKITNVAAGDLTDTSTDAVNGSQLKATNDQVTTNTTNIANNAADITNLGDDVNNIYNTGTKYFHANSTGTDSSATGVDAVAIGMGAIASADGSIALGAGSLADGSTLSHEAYLVGGKAKGEVNLGDRRITGLAAGADDTDAVNVAQLKATAAGSVADAVMYDNTGHNTISLSGSTYNTKTHTGGTIITNVGDGAVNADSSDAVNGSQLYETNQQVANNTTNIANNTTNIDGLKDDALQWDATANGGDGAYSANHMGNGPAKITNVAAGDLTDTSTDAVNGSQLKATNDQVTTNTTNIANNAADITNLGDTVDNIYNTGTKYFHANSTGTDSSATGVDAIAIGMGSVADVARSVALGDGAKTLAAVGTSGTTIQGTDYAFAGVAPVGTVSVGDVGAERTITNVAAGRLSGTSTDAVNGSQLFASNQAIDSINNNFNGLDGRAVKYDLNADGTVNHDRITLEGAPTQITNVKAGELSATSSDAVNGSQLNATNEQVSINTSNIATNTTNINGLKDDALQWDAAANGGNGAYSANHKGNGPAKITNVAAGDLTNTSTDAVNGSQLKATNDQVTNNTVNINGLKQDALLWDSNLGAFSASHGSVTVNKITNVAAGELSEASKDAVNGSQLFATNTNVTNLDNRVTNIEDTINNLEPTQVKYLKVNSKAAGSVATGSEAIAIGPNAVASGDDSIASGNGAISSGIGSIAMGSNADASGDGSVATGSNAKASGKDSTAMGNGAVSTASNSVALGANSLADRADTVSIGSAGHERQITNVAAGSEDTDAVNVAQLKQISGDVTNVNNAITKISNGTDGMFQVNNTNNLSKPIVEGKNALAGGAGSSASGNNSMAVGMQAKSSGTDSVALGNSSSATARNSVALGTNSVADRDNTVSVGSIGGERQIANVAAGTKGTDAVNVSQLNDGINSSYQYTDNKFDSLKNMVDDNKNKMSAGVAGAMAMASLPQPYAPGASMVSLGGGTFQSQSAVALGVSAISDNGKWVTKVAGTSNSQGDFGASLGVGYQW